MHIARSADFQQTGRAEEFGEGRLDGKALIFIFHFRNDKSTK